jgi:hypothetical protein
MKLEDLIYEKFEREALAEMSYEELNKVLTEKGFELSKPIQLHRREKDLIYWQEKN